MKSKLLSCLLFFVILLVACNQPGEPEDSPTSEAGAEETAPTLEAQVEPTTKIPQPISSETPAEKLPAVAQNEATKIPTGTPPATTVPVEPTQPVPEPIEVTYFTSSQGEGPYYPVNKLEDQDNDLTLLHGVQGVPAGEIIEFSGKVYDNTGLPVPGVVVEIWQTDHNGVYLHPGDPGTDQRDKNFQFYGEVVVAADGSYSFRTILPGHYEPRPRHIHVKVRYEGNELLTTQFYFEGDPELADEAMFNQVDGANLIISLVEGQDTGGNPILIGQRDIILNVNLSG